MKKIFCTLCFLFLIFITTACVDNKVLKQEIDTRLQNECSNFQTITSGRYGGGEFEPRGFIKIGYCDDVLVAARSWEAEGEVKYTKESYEFNNSTNVLLDNIFDKTLYYAIETDNSLNISVVVSEKDLLSFANKLKNEFLPLIKSMSKYSMISVNINKTDEIDVMQEKYKVLLVMRNGDDISIYDSEYSQIDYNKIASTIPGIFAIDSSGDIPSQIEEDINTLFMSIKQ